jgi:hypothetical protein
MGSLATMLANKLTILPQEKDSLRVELLQDLKIMILSQGQKKELIYSVLLGLFLACCLAVIIGRIRIGFAFAFGLLLPTRGSSLLVPCL